MHNRDVEKVIARDKPVWEAAAEFCLRLANRSVEDHNAFFWALAGGSTPKKLYQTLTQAPYRQSFPWAQTHVFFGDERCVAADHADSNYRMARENLLDQVPIPENHVHPMAGDRPPEQAAADYDRQVRDLVPGEPTPRLDLVLLGMGDDGHTASLFPDSRALGETEHLVCANHVAKLGAWRLTMTYPLLNAAAHVAFLVTGGNKAEIVRRVLQDGGGIYPIEKVRGEKQIWFLDEQAGGLL